MSLIGFRPQVIDLSTDDQAAATTSPTGMLGVSVQTDVSAEVEFKNGSSGSTFFRIPANSSAGTWLEFGGAPFTDGIYIDAGGSQTGIFTIIRKQYQNEKY